MNYVLAKVKSLRKRPFAKLISNHTLFEAITVDLASCVEYSPDHNLDDDAWFKIEQFSHQTFCLNLLKTEFDSKDFNDLTKKKFEKIAYLVSVQGEDAYFQKVTPSLFIRRKTVVFGEVAAIDECENRLVIKSTPDAVYLKSSDTLIFRNLAAISSVFPGIDQIFREATQTEVAQFLSEPFIELTKNYSADKVSKPNRKRLALAMATLDSLPLHDRKKMFIYIHEYCDKKLKFDKNKVKFNISNDEELKLLIYGIEQRFYTTLLGEERRLANSVQLMT